MSKMLRMELINFRNVKHIVLDFSTGINFVDGDNGIGKSTILGACSMFFNNLLINDNGVKENELDAVKPITLREGESTSIKVTFENGIEATKKLIYSFDSRGKYSGFKQEHYLNAEKYTKQQAWYDKIYEIVNFKPFFKDYKGESVMFSNAINLFQQRDANELRKFLMTLGCYVEPADVLEALKDEYDTSEVARLLPKYSNSFESLKKDVKKMVLEDKALIEKCKHQLEVYEDVEPFDEDDLNSTSLKLSDLRAKYYAIRDDESEQEIREAKAKIQIKKAEASAKITEEKSKINARITELESKYQLEKEKLETQKEDRVKDIRLELKTKESELYSLNEQMRAYRTSLVNIESNLDTASRLGKQSIEEQKQVIIKLDAEMRSSFDGYMNCPVCGSQFVVDTKKKEAFENSKKLNIEKYKKKSQELKDDINKQGESFKTLKAQKTATQDEIDKLMGKMDLVNYDIRDLKANIEHLLAEPVDMSLVNQYQQEIENTWKLLSLVNADAIEQEIQELQSRIEYLTRMSTDYVNDKREVIHQDINALEVHKDELIASKSRYASKLQYEKQLKDAREWLNDHENLFAVVSACSHKLIEMCNKKAYKKTGFKFIMLEENTSNDGLKEVCYMVDDNGVPFKDINTSRKIVYGIKFIKRIKEILKEDFCIPVNDLPILFDKAEEISSATFEAYKDVFDGCQIICTRVTNDNALVIRNN